MITVYILNQLYLLKNKYYHSSPAAYNELHIVCTHTHDNDVILIPKDVECPSYLQNLINKHLLYKGYIYKSVSNYPYTSLFPNLIVTSRGLLYDLSYITISGEYVTDLFRYVDMSIIDEFFNLPEREIHKFVEKQKLIDRPIYWNYSLNMKENLKTQILG